MLDQIKDLPDHAVALWHQLAGAVGTHLARLFGTAGLSGIGADRLALGAFVIVAVSVLVPIFLIGRRGGSASLGTLTRTPRHRGFAAVLVLVALFGGWASVAHLASAALAPGVVSPDGHRKTIQHLEGGIIRAIEVREGDAVAAGGILIRLDDTQARAQLRELRERFARLLAQEARLQAEHTGAEAIAFPAELATMKEIDTRRIIEGERMLLQSRRATQQGREQILTQRIKQLEEETAGLRSVIAEQDRQLALIGQEIDGAQKLYDKGLEKLSRLLALRRAQAQIEAEKASNRANIARNGQKVGETQIQLLTTREQLTEQVSADLTKVITDLAELRSKMAAREDVLDRTTIRAPITGTVMNLRVTTQTGVIQAGQPLLDIVPSDADLIIDAQVKPTDIDNVHPGMRAQVLLTAYRQRTLPQIHGVVRSVSADRMVDDRSGTPYFLAKVKVDPGDLARLRDIRLIPGMPAEVMILNGDRTLFDYMLRPLRDSLTRSFRES